MFDSILLSSQFKWNIPLFVTVICISVLYFILITRESDNKKCKKALLFLLGLSIFTIMLGSPLFTISHLSISLHMFQQSILYFIVPPLVLKGMPRFTIHQNVTIPKIKWFNQIIFHPYFSVSVFAFLMLIYHIPIVLSFSSQHSLFHHASIAILFLFAMGMWRPIAKQHQKKHCIKRYAHWNGILLLPACILMMLYACLDGINNPFLSKFTAHLCLPPQSNSFDILPSPFNTKFDQFIAGFVMFSVHKFSLIVTVRLGSNESHFLGKAARSQTDHGLALEFEKS